MLRRLNFTNYALDVMIGLVLRIPSALTDPDWKRLARNQFRLLLTQPPSILAMTVNTAVLLRTGGKLRYQRQLR